MTGRRDNPAAGQNRVGAAVAFQPEMTVSDLVEPVAETADPIIIHGLTNLLQAWAQTCKDLPDDFAQRFSITRIRRQPLAAILLTAQHVTRTLEMVDTPYSGGPIDKRTWASDDVFALAELYPTEFPTIPESRKLSVVGQEEINPCETCRAVGKVRCNQCGGEGTLNCPRCDGSRQAPCPQCEGQGSVVNASGNIVRCDGCRGNGSVGCPHCYAKGRIDCTVCRRQGMLICHTCAGHGKLRRSWQIDEQVWCEHAQRHICSEPWQLPMHELCEDCAEIAASHWAASPRELDSEWQFMIPKPLHGAVGTLLETAAEKEGSPQQHRISGVHLELRGTYAYEIELDYHGAAPVVLMAGRSGQILPRRMPKVHSGVRRWFDRVLRNFWHEVEVGLRPTVAGTYLRRVRDDKLHPWDVRELLPRVAAELGVAALPNVSGYRLCLPVAASTGEARDVEVNVALDIDEHGIIVLSAESMLGPAHRDRYPMVLRANQSLEFGRIAVIPEPSTGQSELCLVDRRPYEYAEPAGYADVLASLAYEVVEILTRRSFA